MNLTNWRADCGLAELQICRLWLMTLALHISLENEVGAVVEEANIRS